ncbi:hypothetical protein Tco_0535912 [Tanacetum coccineum]
MNTRCLYGKKTSSAVLIPPHQCLIGTAFESWHQLIRPVLSRKGIMGENIMSPSKKDHFQKGTVSDVIAWRNRGAVQQGPERLKESNFDQLYAYLKQHEVHANENRIMMERFSQPNNDPLALVSDASVQQYPTQSSKSPQTSAEPYPSDSFQMDSGRKLGSRCPGRYNANYQGRTISSEKQCKRNCVAGIVRRRIRLTNVMITKNDLALNVDHVFEADECDAFDSDVDEGPITQTMFMTNLTSEDLIYDEAGTSYDSNTPSEIFWSIDDNNRKKAETLAPKPISALTVYPPNTPVKLVPRILPTKSQVKINLYGSHTTFTEFDKTCKTRITPTGITEGERGFEQRRKEYLTEVIPFFKTLKEHFVGVQTTLFKEVKEMEEIFDQMNNEVDKNTIDKQYLEADMSKVHDESKLISKLEREYLNLQLKYQHLQESFDNKNSQASQEAPDFNSFFKIKNLEHQIQEKDNVIRNLKVLVANVNDRSCEPYNAKDVTALIEQNDCVRIELEKVKQHYKELISRLDNFCPKSFNERDNKAPSTPVTRKKQVTFSDKPGTSSSNTQKHKVHQRVQQTNIPVIPSTGVNDSTEASGSKPRSNTKKNRILPAKKENKKEVEVRLRTNKSVWTKVNRVDSSISSKRVVINSNSESWCQNRNKCVNSASHGMCVVNILNSVNATSTVTTVLNKGKQIWKPKGRLSDNSLYKTKRVWKATGKLFAEIGFISQWRPIGMKLTIVKTMIVVSQWRPKEINLP